MKEIKKILIIKGSSQYGAARCFCDELMRAFCNMGHLVTMLDLTTFPDAECGDMFAQYDMIFSFDLAGIELYNTMSVKPFFWTMLIDPPIYLNERLKQMNGDVMVSCIDRRHVSYIDRYYKNITWTCFMPHGGVTGKIPALIPYKERSYDAVIMGSLQPLDLINTVIDSLKKDYGPLISDIIDDAMLNPDADLTIIVFDKIKESGADFDDSMFREFMYIIRGIDALRRFYKRKALVEGLIGNGVPVDIWGIGWEQIADKYESQNLIKLHGEVSYEESKYIISNSKILINDMPPYHEGSHERVFMGMQCRTIVASDRSIFLEECFKDNEDILFYDTNDIRDLASRITGYLQDPVKAQNIIDNAYQSSDIHTWASRTAAILEITDTIHHDPVLWTE